MAQHAEHPDSSPRLADSALRLATERLILRRWRESDLEPFRQLNADPRVMEFMPGLLDAAASDALVARIERHFDQHGFGPFAVELRASGEFIGFTGIFIPDFEAPFTPAVEIGWRLAHQHWGHGYATEAARETLRFAFEDNDLAELVSFTVPTNLRSRAVMERLGMHHNPADDFEHPRLPPGHPFRPHVLYRLTRDEWRIQR